jgi:hypothetical protein
VCTECRGFAWKGIEPDGVSRCFGHSRDPLNIEKRKANAAKGKAAGEMQRGIAKDQLGAVMAGVIPIEKARAEKAADDAKSERRIAPIPLDSKENVLAFLGRVAGELMQEQPNGWASAAASLANAALKAMGVEEQGGVEEEVGAFEFRVVSKPPARVADA